MSEPVYNVLFLCTGNSARSIMAEALLNFHGRGHFRGYSAGSFPQGTVHPRAIERLNEHQLPTAGLRSKSWHELAVPGAPVLDFVFTVCDNAANEVCPIWPGQPVSAHWGLPDPAAVTGSEVVQRQAFYEAFHVLEYRIKRLTQLPLHTLDKSALHQQLHAIGHALPGDSTV